MDKKYEHALTQMNRITDIQSDDNYELELIDYGIRNYEPILKYMHIIYWFTLLALCLYYFIIKKYLLMSKCKSCLKKILGSQKKVSCTYCKYTYHMKCVYLSKDIDHTNETLLCHTCINENLPFGDLCNDDL